METEVKLYQVTKGCAKWKNIPLYFVARVIAETGKALYLYGHSTAETAKKGICCQCGRELTHPVSIELGIDPECGSHYWNWDLVGGYTKENVARLMHKIRHDIVIDSWIPKGLIVSIEESSDTVTIPDDHAMMKTKGVEQPTKTATMAQNTYGERVVRINFPYNIDDLSRVRELTGRKYHSEDKCWSAPVSIETVQALKSWGFSIDSKLDIFLQKADIKIDNIPDVEVSGLKGTLFPFQKKGVAFMEAHDGRVLIADEMGLGKTIQALAWLQLHPELRPAIIVVPASLKLNWKREAETWMPNPKIEVLSGTSMRKILGEIIVINYDILADWLPALQVISPKVLIMDEVHYIKNNAARRTKAAKQLGKGIPHVSGLSGTPIVNRPVEAFNAMKLIDPDFIPFWDYVHRYCGAKNTKYGWDFSGATNTEELHQKLVKTMMIRRLKKDVLSELPEKLRSFMPIELDNEREYHSAEADFVAFVKKTKGQAAADRTSNAETLAEIEGLKQLAVRGKLNECIEWIRDFIEVDGKLVVFAVHKFVIDELMNAFPNISVKVDGSVTGEGRQKAVDDFQNNPNIRLFVGNIKAAGIGITLTAASNVAFLELPWTPGDLVQAEDRCHRIGQKNSVTIHYLLASGTIEEKIAKLIDHKRIILDAVLDGKETTEESLLTALMKEYGDNN